MNDLEVYMAIKEGKMSLAEFTAYVVECEEDAYKCGYFDGYDAAEREYSN